jgi:hypothetical protein
VSDRQALDVARALAAAGVPVLVAYPDPEGKTQSGRATGYALRGGWQATTPNPDYVGAWRPGLALVAVMGCGIDLVDIDPRNGGDLAALGGILPEVIGEAESPSGGRHLFVASMGVRSRDDVLPGIDVKAGDPEGQGRGFAFIAPTVRPSKVTGERVAYRWIKPPDLTRLQDTPCGGHLADLVRQVHGRTRSGPGFQQPGGHSEGWTDPDIAQLIREGIPSGAAQQPVLRDVVARLVGQGYDQVACWGIWQAIVDRTTLTAPEWPWTEPDFADMYDSAAGKYGTRPRAPSGPRGTKEEERTKPVVPPMPSADPSMYTGILGDVVGAAAPTTEADPVGIYASLLAGTGVIIGPSPYVRVGNTHHPLLIWPLLLGRTGSGRKGEATTTGEIFLRNADHEAWSYMVSGLSSGEGLIERIRDPDDAEQSKFQQPGGTHDKRLLVLETEFSSVLARSKREGSTLAAVQRQAWEGRGLSVLNRKQLKASASHIAIIGHITPREFRLRLAESDMTGGTYNRYLPLFVERSQRLPIPEGVPDHVVADLSGSLARAIGAARKITQVQLGEEATQLWAGELYDELTAGDDEDLAEAEFTRRAAPYCLRTAGLFAVLDGRRLISKPDLAAAAAVIRYSIASAKYVLDRQVRDPRLDRIRRAVDAAGNTGLTRTEISALFSRNLTKEVLGELLAQLVEDGEYEESRTATGGRPAETYRRVLSSSFVPKEAQP